MQMKKYTRLFIVLLANACFMGVIIYYGKPEYLYTDGNMYVYDSANLTREIIENRNGKAIIERCYGTVTDDDKNGVDDNGNYISYFYVDGAEKGDRICSYFVYGTYTNDIDDIVNRFDFIVGRDCK